MFFALKSTSLTMQAAFADIPALTVIHQKCFSRGWLSSEFQTLLQDKLVDCYVLRRSNLRITDQTIGFVLARTVIDEAEVLTIAVDPDYQKSGAGRQLMKELIRHLYGNRVKKLFLEVDAQNKAALKLYEGLGFVKVGERKGYYAQQEGEPSLAYIMQLDLSGGHTSAGSSPGSKKASQ